MTLFGGGGPEEAAIDVLRERPIILDVGANKGDFSRLALERRPGAIIHAFEPNPECHAYLEELPVTLHTVACGGLPGRATLYYTIGPCELGSLRRRELERIGYEPGDHGQNRIEVPVTTVDLACAKNGIIAVDLLKIDAEGSEPEILAGACNLIARRAVRNVLFEFGVDWQFEDGYEPNLPVCGELLEGYRLSMWDEWNQGPGGWKPVADLQKLQDARIFGMFMATREDR